MHANIDGDVLIYRAGFAVERTCYKIKFADSSYRDLQNKYTRTQIVKKLKEKKWEEGSEFTLIPYKLYEKLENALHLCNTQINSIIKATNADSHTLFLSSNDGSNFRYKVAKTEGPRGIGYKAGRPSKPKYYNEIRTYLLEDCDGVEIFEMEADDALGIYQTEGTIACHQDKDIDMIPGKHYNFIAGEFYEVSDPGELYLEGRKLKGGGLKWFYAQMLMGDSIDNIPGVGRYGPKTTYSILKGQNTESQFLNTIWDIYYSKFKEKALSRLEEVANLLWIKRKITDNKGRDLRHTIEETKL